MRSSALRVTRRLGKPELGLAEGVHGDRRWGGGQWADGCSREINVLLDAALVLEGLELLLEVVVGDVEDDVAVHVEEAAVAIPGEALVGVLGEAEDGAVVEAQVEDGVHHAGHGEGGARAHRNEEGVVVAGELEALVLEVVLHVGHGACHVLPDVLGDAVAAVLVELLRGEGGQESSGVRGFTGRAGREFAFEVARRKGGGRRGREAIGHLADISGDGEARGHVDADAAHLAEAGALATEALLHLDVTGGEALHGGGAGVWRSALDDRQVSRRKVARNLHIHADPPRFLSIDQKKRITRPGKAYLSGCAGLGVCLRPTVSRRKAALRHRGSVN